MKITVTIDSARVVVEDNSSAKINDSIIAVNSIVDNATKRLKELIEFQQRPRITKIPSTTITFDKAQELFQKVAECPSQEPIVLTLPAIDPAQFKVMRQSKGLTLREVQGLTGISNAYLSQLESGKIKSPSYATIKKLVDALGPISVMPPAKEKSPKIKESIKWCRCKPDPDCIFLHWLESPDSHPHWRCTKYDLTLNEGGSLIRALTKCEGPVTDINNKVKIACNVNGICKYLLAGLAGAPIEMAVKLSEQAPTDGKSKEIRHHCLKLKTTLLIDQVGIVLPDIHCTGQRFEGGGGTHFDR